MDKIDPKVRELQVGMMTMKELCDEMDEMEKKIDLKLQELPEYGEECKCNDRNTYPLINYDGDYLTVDQFCLSCGGWVEPYR